MKNKLVFLLIILFVIGFVSAASSVKFFLSKTNYAGNELFKGNLSINESNADITQYVSADITNCGSYGEKTIKLYDLLVKNGLYTGSEKKYTAGAVKNNIIVDLDESTDKVFGVNVNHNVDSVSFSISGSASEIFIDVGNDGTNDWKYRGSMVSWTDTIINSLNYPGSYNLNDVVEYNPSNAACQDFNVSYENFTSSLDLMIFAVAKTSGTGTLSAKIGSRTCSFSGVGSSWTNVSCNITMDVSQVESPHVFQVCLQANSDKFRIPQKTGSNFFYTSLRLPYYIENLYETSSPVNDLILKNAMHDYYNANCNNDEWCVIPLRLNVLTAGKVNLSDLVLKFGSSTATNFYEINSGNVKLNLTDKLISLDSFEDLKTPDVSKKQVCMLKIKYNSEYYQTNFSMSAGPIAYISTPSYYLGKNLPVEFDGSNSRTFDNKNVTSYSWDFGDGSSGTGSKVSHTFTEYGNYSVVLTVKDSIGIEDRVNISVHVLPLEEYLTNQFAVINQNIGNSISYLNSQTGETKEFIDIMGYIIKINQVKSKISQLQDNFTAIKDSSLTNKDSEYSKIVGGVVDVNKDVIVRIQQTGSKNVKNLILTSPDDIFGYGSKRNVSLGYQNALYKFNNENVVVNMSMVRFYVSSLETSDYFGLVKKTVTVNGGKNNIVVEDLRNYDINQVYSNLSKDVASKVIYTNVNNQLASFSYVVKTEGLTEIKSIVFSDVQIEKELYCFNNAVNCQSYCGDGICDVLSDYNIDESDKNNQNYCAADCQREIPVWNYIALLGGFLLLLIYLFLYKGPGSFKHISNKVTYWFINKRLFMSEQDRLSLNQFVINAFRKGYNEIQIRQVLLKKGWNNKQINSIMENYIKKRY